MTRIVPQKLFSAAQCCYWKHFPTCVYRSGYSHISRYSTAATSTLQNLEQAIQKTAEEKVKTFKFIKQTYGSLSIANVKVDAVLGGMRGMINLLTETSVLDADSGITFRGYTIEECLKLLPSAVSGGSPLPEGLLWLLLTGQIPAASDVQALSELLTERCILPDYIKNVLDALPKGAHPMSQLVVAISALSNESSFEKQYNLGLPKSKYWIETLNDGLSLIAKVPLVAAYIYQRCYKEGQLPEVDASKDWAANYASMLGFDTAKHEELMRLYLFLHADHEGGNVSSHAGTLVGSALSNPYLSFSASMAGLAGPLHGLANQESLKWLRSVHASLKGEEPTVERIQKIARDTLNSGQVVPGFGHAVLRVTDPRFLAQNAFSKKNLPDSELFKLLEVCVKAIPPILMESGKVKNPYPNVDLHSGVVLQYHGLVEEDYYTVLFGVSRSLGVVAQLVWSRIFGLPIERPKSITLDQLLQLCEPKATS